MKTQYLIYDPQLSKEYFEKLTEILPVHDIHKTKYDPARFPDLPADTTIILCLDDERVAELLPKAAEKKLIVGFLPHPDAPKVKKEFGIDPDPEKAYRQIAEYNGCIKTDALYCNDRLVLQSVLIGDALSIPQDRIEKNMWLRIVNAFRRVGRLYNIRHHLYTLKSKDKAFEEVETSALGIVVVERMNALLLTKKLEADTFINDGFLNALIMAPKSKFEMLGFLFRSVIPGMEHVERLPPFIGLLKTSDLTIECGESVTFLMDGIELNAKEITLRVEANAIQIIPGQHLKLPDSNKTGKQKTQTDRLPKGETAKELASRNLPLIKRATQGDFRDLFSLLRENARMTNIYLIMMTLSTLLAAFGLYANSAPVVIGAMILAPLISPIVSIAMGSVRQDISLLKRSSKTLLVGTVLALLATALFSLIIPIKIPTPEIDARTSPTLLDMGIAFLSGIAAAYTHAREELAKSLAGIAIAVALVPPLAVAGVGIGWGDTEVFFGGFVLYLTNLTGIIVSAGLTFILLGFAPFKIAKKGIIIATVMLLPVSVPLSIGFSKMYREATIIRKLEKTAIEGHKIRDLKVRTGEPVTVSLQLVSEHRITDREIDQIKAAFEDRLNQEINLEIVTAIRR